MKIIEGQQIGYNSLASHYFKLFWYYLLFLIGIAGCLIFIFFDINPFHLSWWQWLLSIIFLLISTELMVKEEKKSKGRLKYFLFEDYLLNNNKQELPFGIFEYAILSNNTCIIISKSKQSQLKFKIKPDIDKTDFLNLINQKIKLAKKPNLTATYIEEDLDEIE